MSNVNAEPKPSVYEMTEKELDRVSGGGTKSATKNSGSTVPRENISISFSTLSLAY